MMVNLEQSLPGFHAVNKGNDIAYYKRTNSQGNQGTNGTKKERLDARRLPIACHDTRTSKLNRLDVVWLG